MLMLIDTPDPRYGREPERRAPWSQRHPRARVWLPIAACVACVLAAYVVGPPLWTFVLTVAAMMFFFDGALALMPTGDGLWSNRQ
jgi:hypothetical protein